MKKEFEKQRDTLHLFLTEYGNLHVIRAQKIPKSRSRQMISLSENPLNEISFSVTSITVLALIAGIHAKQPKRKLLLFVIFC